jgi:hypothetical protein
MAERASASRFAESNGCEEQCLDGNGGALQGTVVACDGAGGLSILRFFNGFLDGDRGGAGGAVIALPAVESPGHLEWWRAGRLHRDNGLPAVIAENFTLREWWENGKRVR